MSKEDKLLFTILSIEIIVIMIGIIIGVQISPDAVNSPANTSACKYVYDNQTGQTYSEDCREECGCEIIEEYNLIVDVDDVGNVINDIVNNMTNKIGSEI